MLHCLEYSGFPLTNKAKATLLETAQKMWIMREKIWGMDFSHCGGRISSNLTYVLYGAGLGVKFTANIETESGHTRLDFILHDCDLIQLQSNREQPSVRNTDLN
jgi:hypothetical protein